MSTFIKSCSILNLFNYSRVISNFKSPFYRNNDKLENRWIILQIIHTVLSPIKILNGSNSLSTYSRFLKCQAIIIVLLAYWFNLIPPKLQKIWLLQQNTLIHHISFMNDKIRYLKGKECPGKSNVAHYQAIVLVYLRLIEIKTEARHACIPQALYP